MSYPDEPNLIIPMASTVNERGVAGYTHSVTNSEDQRKLNCFYELSKNQMTGKGTLTLTKRPGVTIDANTYGTSAQAAYLAINAPGNAASYPAVFYTVTAGADIKVSTSAFTRLILSSAFSLRPTYVDFTAISNAQVVVLQMVNTVTQTAHSVSFVTVANLSAGNAWTAIVDADFTGLQHVGKMEHLDGYAFILAGNNLIWNSTLNELESGTGTSWVATNFLAKQMQQDRAVGLARLSNKLLAFGENTVEVFYNAGNTTGSPLGRITQLNQRIGLVPMVQSSAGGTHYYATSEDKIYFVGRRSGGAQSLGVFFFNGQNFNKVSSAYIDKILSEQSGSLYSVNALGFNGQSAVAICLTAPTAATQRSLLFFPEWKEWFEWTSTVFSPVNGGGYHLGVSQPHKLYTFAASDKWQDDTTSYQWFSQFKLPTKGSPRNVLNMYGVDADTARSANDLTVEISRDDCVSFSTVGTIDLTQDRKVGFRGGPFRNAYIRLGNTNAVETRIHNFLARLG
jgi:hypothetical protein